VVVEKKICNNFNLKSLLITYIDTFKAGSPIDSSIFWISKKPKEIAKGFNEKHGQQLSNSSVKKLLIALGYRYRKQTKQLATGKYEHRNIQFEIITTLILTMSLQSPVISIDCKKNRTAEAGTVR
jgi:hypothetical protein